MYGVWYGTYRPGTRQFGTELTFESTGTELWSDCRDWIKNVGLNSSKLYLFRIRVILGHSSVSGGMMTNSIVSSKISREAKSTTSCVYSTL